MDKPIQKQFTIKTSYVGAKIIEFDCLLLLKLSISLRWFSQVHFSLPVLPVWSGQGSDGNWPSTWSNRQL